LSCNEPVHEGCGTGVVGGLGLNRVA